MARFVVDLGENTLSPEQHQAMASAIHSAVLSQIATHPVKAGAAPMAAIATIDGAIHRPAASDLSKAHEELKAHHAKLKHG